jgi:ORF6N domain
MRLMKPSLASPIAAVHHRQQVVIQDHLLCRGGSICVRLQWPHCLALLVWHRFLHENRTQRSGERNTGNASQPEYQPGIELAVLHGVMTRRLNEQVRRNPKRFPDDFLFELTTEEFVCELDFDSPG